LAIETSQTAPIYLFTLREYTPSILLINPLSGGSKRSSPETEPLADERSAKCTLQTTLETVDAELNDATDTRLDTLVLKTFKELVKSILVAAFLLLTIVSNSEGRLDQKYSHSADARVLIEENLELVDMLKEAWNGAITVFFLTDGDSVTLIQKFFILVQVFRVAWGFP
jgi:hypothetical protein